MRITRLAVALIAFATTTMITSEASAMYHPGMGRFMQRDPGPNAASPPRVGATGPSVRGGFMPRDQYADGMNLYQYVCSNPLVYVDPRGEASMTTNVLPGW